jgi:hypothetical protein
MNVDKIKGLLRSKTFWWNISTIAIESGALLGILGVPPGTVSAISALGNIVLRTITTQSLEVKVRKDE